MVATQLSPVVTILAAIKRPAYFPIVTFDRIEPIKDVGFHLAVETVPSIPAASQLEVLVPPGVNKPTRCVTEMNGVVDLIRFPPGVERTG